MNKKLGPLKVWHWAIIGVAAGLAYYLYQRHLANSAQGTASLQPASPTSGDVAAGPAATGGGDVTSPVNPTDNTNPPGADTSTNQPTLADELTNVGTVLDLLSSLESMTNPPAQNPPANVTNIYQGTKPHPGSKVPTITTHPGGAFYKWYVQMTGHKPPNKVKVTDALYKLWQSGFKPKTSSSNKNPGHTQTTHPGGNKTASSSSHNAGRRSPGKPVAPSNHQRHTTPKKHKKHKPHVSGGVAP